MFERVFTVAFNFPIWLPLKVAGVFGYKVMTVIVNNEYLRKTFNRELII